MFQWFLTSSCLYAFHHCCSSKIIWLGDLNYRLASICGDTYKILEKNDWQALLEKDQVRDYERVFSLMEKFNLDSLF